MEEVITISVGEILATHSSILEKLVVRVTCDPHFIIQAAVKAS